MPEYFPVKIFCEVHKTDLNMLTLYEYYLMASLFKTGSPQFREIIERATEIYPNEKINRISMAMFSYLSNDIPRALAFIQGLEDDPEVWSYFSSFHIRNNELDKAEHYAKRALESGNSNAVNDLELIRQYKADETLYKEKMEKWKTMRY